jgi:hypothetical protein
MALCNHMSLLLKMAAFWDTAPCSLVEVARRFRGVYRHHQGVEYLLLIIFKKLIKQLICVIIRFSKYKITHLCLQIEVQPPHSLKGLVTSKYISWN